MNKLIAMIWMLCGLALPAWAGDEVKLEDIKVDNSMAAVERGADTLMNVCHGCHSLKYVRYRDLVTAGIDKKKVDAWRGDQALDAAMTGLLPDDTAMQMYGKIPPDLSLMTKAREGGTNYVYSYLIGYYIAQDGATGNHVFPATRMPDMLGISGATDAAQRSEIQHKAQDVVSFLAWASDPHEEERRKLGFYVIAYLFVLTALLYVVKKQIWSRLK